MITAEKLRGLFNYDPDTGVFTRLIRRGRFPAGSVAGHLREKDGYGRRIDLGRFETPELAHAAYIEAKRKFHEGNTL